MSPKAVLRRFCPACHTRCVNTGKIGSLSGTPLENLNKKIAGDFLGQLRIAGSMKKIYYAYI